MAVNSQIASIIANGYNRLAQISLEIVHNWDDGFGLSEKQNELRKRLIKGTKILRRISKFVEFDDDGNYVTVHRLTDQQINDLLKYLIKVLDIKGLPVAPRIFYRGYPYVRVQGSAGNPGDQGEQGPAGGGVAFSSLNFSGASNEVDRFALADAIAARWDYVLWGSLGRRTGTLRIAWSDNGLTISDPSDFATNDIGTTVGNISFTAVLDGTDIVLKANRVSGTWNVRGLRYFPNNNAVLPSSGILPNGKIYVGDSADVATARTPGGVVSMTNAGIYSFVPGSIVNADINAGAAIAYSKLNLSGSIVNADIASGAAIAYSKLNLAGSIVNADIASGAAIARSKIASGTAYRVVVNDSGGALAEVSLTANRAMAVDGNGLPTVVATTATELGYVNLVTSPIQAQIDGKQATITGAATTVTTTDLTPNRLLISDASGKIAVSAGGSGAGIPGGSANELQKNGGGVFSGAGLYTTGSGIFTVPSGNLRFEASAGDFTILTANGAGITANHTGTNDVYRGLLITRTTPDTPAAGIGVKIEMEVETASGNNEIGSSIETVTTSVTPTSESFDIIFRTLTSGSDFNERFRIGPNSVTVGGSSVLLGSSVNSATLRQFTAQGTAANIDITVVPKGTGIITLDAASGVKTTGGIDAGNNGMYIKTKVIQIGDWNMDTTASVSINHGLTLSQIRSVSGVIIRDDSTFSFPIGSVNGSAGLVNVGFGSISATQVSIFRTTGGDFDNTNYDLTPFNRGWIFIEYEA